MFGFKGCTSTLGRRKEANKRSKSTQRGATLFCFAIFSRLPIPDRRSVRERPCVQPVLQTLLPPPGNTTWTGVTPEKKSHTEYCTAYQSAANKKLAPSARNMSDAVLRVHRMSYATSPQKRNAAASHAARTLDSSTRAAHKSRRRTNRR